MYVVFYTVIHNSKAKYYIYNHIDFSSLFFLNQIIYSIDFLHFSRMMSKQLFALSLLITYSVVSARYPLDRQLQEGADQGTGNEWQYCEDTCNKTCEPCEQHHVCAEDEIKCGEGPTRVSPDGFVLHLCAKDEICVSDKCGCK